ncbi:MAG: hypothetical protein HPY44_13845 [Armatimonadetes bacterium]|nr:hypothetical protein [Armatimonadota bacterium]
MTTNPALHPVGSLLVALVLVAGACSAQVRLPVDFSNDPGWIAHPTFLGNAAANPQVIAEDGAVTLRVSEPGKGMKFELPLRDVAAETSVYLVLRYRALNLAGGYAIWVYDGSASGKEVLNVAELVRDGQWHTIAVDLAARGAQGGVRSVLTEVQCREEPAWISFDHLDVTDDAPADATVIPASATPLADYVLRPGEDLENLRAEPGWLANDAAAFAAESDNGVLHLSAEGADKGMKWSATLREPVDLSGYRFVAIRYRAQGTAPWGDYLLWLSGAEGGMPQQSQRVISLPQVEPDGQWHVLVLPFSADFTATHAAVQVCSKGERGDVWIDTVRFSARRPRFRVSEVLPVSEGWGGSMLARGNVRPVEVPDEDTTLLGHSLRAMGLSSWFPQGEICVRGVPFRLTTGEPRALMTPDNIDEMAKLEVGQSGSELYLLLAGQLPATDGSRMGDPVPMRQTSAPERFVFRVEYADGLVDEMFPICLVSGRYELRNGPEVYCLTGLRDEKIARVSLRNRMESGKLWLAAATVNGGPAATQEPEVQVIPPPVSVQADVPGDGRITPNEGGFLIANDLLAVDVQTRGGVRLRGLSSPLMQGPGITVEPGPLFSIGRDETTLTSEQVSVGEALVEAHGERTVLRIPVDGTEGGVALRGELRISVGDGPDIGMELDLEQASEEVFTPKVSFPLVNGLRIGSAKDTWYLWGRKGGIISNRPTHQRQTYGGEYPLQVADAFSPAAGAGLALLTYDLDNDYRYWDLVKDQNGIAWRLDFWEREYQPQERIETCPVALRAHSGDWRAALGIYRDWVKTWYKPQVPRKQWFQEVFYYQQTFAWGSLRNNQTGEWKMKETIEKYRDYFGRLDYLHIFDFGASRVYGRVGDYSHYDELGGREAIREAIRQAQDAGVRVGLYIEGYLCDIRGEWGRENVPKYNMRRKDGSPFLWEPDSTEHMMCADAKGWRDHLASTYERVAGELQPDGMYIDQYGFLNPWKTCWSREHGHPVPWGPIRGEAATLKAIRSSVPEEIATLTEETPNDVNSQFQDGALGYSVTWSDPDLMPHRVDLFRFMFPDFKVFQLVSYNAFTEGGWDLLKWPFFNGEGLWTHGGTTGFYCEDAHQFLRGAFAIQHEHRAAFCADDVEPLVPTLVPTVYANRFTGGGETVWTLFNAGYRTFRGEALSVPHLEGARYSDAMTGELLDVRLADGKAYIPVQLGPHGVGCVVMREP